MPCQQLLYPHVHDILPNNSTSFRAVRPMLAAARRRPEQAMLLLGLSHDHEDAGQRLEDGNDLLQ